MKKYIAQASFFVKQSSMLSVLFLCTMCLFLPVSSSGNVVFLNGFEAVAEFTQQAYIKALNTDQGESFGRSLALDGNTLLVGATRLIIP